MEIRCLLDDDKRIPLCRTIYVLSTHVASLVFYPVGEPMDESFMLSIAMKTYEAFYPQGEQDQIVVWHVCKTGVIQ